MRPDPTANSPDSFDLPVDALTQILNALRPLDRETRQRVLTAVAALVRADPQADSALVGPNVTGVEVPSPARTSAFSQARSLSVNAFSQDRSPTAKEFLIEKKPRTDVDRVACLAFYLTYYRNQPQFKTLDLSVANTEAAQPKFANAAQAVDNAVRSGILLLTGGGQKQLSAAGELYVQQLPDYEGAKAALHEHRKGRRR